MTDKLDERLGLPSASSALFDSLCAGRWRAQQEFAAMTAEPETEEDESEEIEEQEGGPSDSIDKDAEAGKRIHLLYAGRLCPEASGAEEERADAGREVDQKMYRRWLEVFAHEGESNVMEMRERRWWLKDGDRPIYSGQTDVVWIRGRPGEHADILVGDLKGLWGNHDPARLNMQIRRYIALVSVNIQVLGYSELRSAMAYLNQPAKTMSPVPVLFDQSDIEQAVMEMHIELGAMMDEDAPRTPGPIQCHRCLAKPLCFEFIESTKDLPVLVTAYDLPSKEALTDKVAKLSGHQLAQMLPWAAALRNLADLAESEAKRRLGKDETSVPGYKLKKNPARSKVDDVTKVFTRLSEQFQVTPEIFTPICTLTKKAVIDLIREKAGLKGQSLTDKVNEILDSATHSIPVSNSLERIE